MTMRVATRAHAASAVSSKACAVRVLTARQRRYDGRNQAGKQQQWQQANIKPTKAAAHIGCELVRGVADAGRIRAAGQRINVKLSTAGSNR